MADKEGVELQGDLDALVRQVMAVEPSPGFVTRLRERIAQERHPSWWTAPWIMVPAVAAAAALAVAMGLALLSGTPLGAPPHPDTPPRQTASTAHPPPEPPAIRQAAPPRAQPVVAGLARAATRSPAAPGVIVDQQQRAGLSLFVRMAQQGRLPDDILAQTIPASNPSIEERVRPITVEPVAVSSIPAGGVLPSGGERN